VDDFWATKSEGIRLSVHALGYQDFQPMWSWSTNVTDRQSDVRRGNRNTALCMIVHRAVKTQKSHINILQLQ